MFNTLTQTYQDISEDECATGKYVIGDDAVQSGFCMVVLARDTQDRPCLCKFVFSNDREILNNEASIRSLFPPPLPVPGIDIFSSQAMSAVSSIHWVQAERQ